MRNIKIEKPPLSCESLRRRRRGWGDERHFHTWNRPRSRFSLFFCCVQFALPNAADGVLMERWCCRCVHEYLDLYVEVKDSNVSDLINSPFGGRYCGPIAPRRRISLYRTLALGFFTDKNSSYPELFGGSYAFVNDCECVLVFLCRLAQSFLQITFALAAEPRTAWGRPFFTPAAAAPASIMDFWAAGSVALGQNTGTSQNLLKGKWKPVFSVQAECTGIIFALQNLKISLIKKNKFSYNHLII